MRKRQLPPLNALRGFEAAARHLSFTKAAEELLVTQGAVSRQIRDLEVYLGQTLFRRLIRRVELTEEGSRLFSASRTYSMKSNALRNVAGNVPAARY